MVNEFYILSGEVFFSHKFEEPEDWILELKNPKKSTVVFMEVNNHTTHTTKQIFDKYTSTEDEEYGFNKTVVPVELAQYGDEQLISRSQAKRLLSRVELFKVVMFDFTRVDSIGQAFADEIFRVFAQKHPDIELIPIHTNKEIDQMMSRAKSVRL
jgi:hypothetical protein